MHESYKKWIEDGCPKVICKCGCDKEIVITKYHKYNGIPKYINGHNSKGKNNPNFGKREKDTSMFGKHHSEKTIEKMSKAQEGEKNHNFGKHWKLSKDTIEKMSKSKKGNKYRLGIRTSTCAGYGKGCYYDSPLQGKIWLRSSYELKFAEYLDKNNIDWLYEIQTFDLGNTTYTPDFYLPTCNLFIEIKGYMLEKAQDKINKFLDIYHEETLKILYKEDLIKLGIEIN